MLKITNHSENYNGIIELDGANVADVDGSIAKDNVYLNVNIYDMVKAKVEKSSMATDVSEFMNLLLTDETPVEDEATEEPAE